MNQLTQVHQYLIRSIWEPDVHKLPPWHARFIGALRIIYLLVRDVFLESQLTMQAMSLVYTTLLALVPLIAVSVSVLKGFGLHQQIEPALQSLLDPLGQRGEEITRNIIQFVNNINSGLLGSLGLALLLYTVISLMQKIEQAFNHTWRVSEERSFAQRFSDYLSVILIGPVLVFAAMGLTASVENTKLYQKLISIPVLEFMVGTVSLLLPFLLVILAFTLIYIYIPNTRVRFRSALGGATIAGIGWQLVGWLFTWFVSNANYTAIYSAFATLFFFMIWLYVSWSILLIGADIAFYFQHPEQRLRERKVLHLSNRMKERLALAVMAEIGRHFYRREPPCTIADLSESLRLAAEAVHACIDVLQQQGLLARTDGEPSGYVPAQAPETMTLLSIINAVRRGEEDEVVHIQRLPSDVLVDQYFDRYQAAAAQTLAAVTLKDLVGAE